jgi:hypothetical protein
MRGFWIKFTDGSEGYCEGESEYDAVQIAQKLTSKTVGGGPWSNFTMTPLPYPATPIIWQFDHPINGKCPAFCFQPRKCAGHTSCPNSTRACTE